MQNDYPSPDLDSTGLWAKTAELGQASTATSFEMRVLKAK